MYVCLCKGITENRIREAVHEGALSMRALHRELGVASQCSKCTRHAREVLREALLEHQSTPEELIEQPVVGQWMPQPA